MSGTSVITLVKGRYHQLQRLIEGLQRNDAVPAELVVVDMQGEWQAPRNLPFAVKVVALLDGKLPLARARNVGANAACGEQMLFLDVDCIPRGNLVREIGRVLSSTDALICAEVRYLGPHDVADDWHEARLLGAARLHPVRSFPEHGLRRETNAGLFWSLAFGIRRQTFLNLGGFDVAFQGYGAEDTDFGFRAAEVGIELLFLGGTGVLHQYHAVFDPPLQHFDDIVCNARIFHRKWRVWPMQGWLQAFSAARLIDFDKESITVLRHPGADELERARSMGYF